MKLLDVNAEDAEKWERLKKKKKNPDQGFSGTVQNLIYFMLGLFHFNLLPTHGLLDL